MSKKIMEILKCKKCGYELFPTDTVCDRCGEPINKNDEVLNNSSIQELNKNIRAKKITNPITVKILIALGTVVCITIIGFFTFFYLKMKPYRDVVKIMTEDKASNLSSIIKIWYNKEQKTCVVEFINSRKKRDTAFVRLDKKTVGYESVFKAYAGLSALAWMDEQMKNTAQELIGYSYYYDPASVYAAAAGNEHWKLVYIDNSY